MRYTASCYFIDLVIMQHKTFKILDLALVQNFNELTSGYTVLDKQLRTKFQEPYY
jgi:hypothetical protein